MVTSVSVAVWAVPVPSKVTEVGTIEHVELAGKPVQLRLICPLKLPKGVTVMVDKPDDPGLMVSVEGDADGVK